MIYDIYWLQLGFSPVAVVGKPVQKQETEYKNRKEKKILTAVCRYCSAYLYQESWERISIQQRRSRHTVIIPK